MVMMLIMMMILIVTRGGHNSKAQSLNKSQSLKQNCQCKISNCCLFLIMLLIIIFYSICIDFGFAFNEDV